MPLGIIILTGTFVLTGVIIVAAVSYCDALYYGTGELHVIVLPNLHNLSSSEQDSLLGGTYELSSNYNLQLIIDPQAVNLCILKKHFTRTSPCIQVGTDMENTWICTPDTRPDCLPSAIIDSYFGLSLWKQEESTVVYNIVDIEASEIYPKTLTNTTTTLSAVWYDLLDCQSFMNFTISVIIFGILFFICCLGYPVCLCICYHSGKKKRWGRIVHIIV